MDALSALLEDIHLTQAKFFTVHGHGDWSFKVQLKPGALLFVVVVSGEFEIQSNQVQASVSSGDMLMLPRALDPVCTHKDQSEPLVTETIEVDSVPNNGMIQLGRGYMNAQVILAWCEYDQEMAKPLISSLPSILPEPSGQPGGAVIMQQVGSSLGRFGTAVHAEVLKIGLAYLAVEVQTERMGQATMLNRLGSMLMVECLREYIEGLDETSTSWLLALKDKHLAKAIAALHAQPEAPWTLATLAQTAGMSRSSFAERFREVMSETPLTYLAAYRLRLAARFLRLEQYSIGRISEMVGYASDSTFSQAFKREYGLSPMQYRQQPKD